MIKKELTLGTLGILGTFNRVPLKTNKKFNANGGAHLTN
jgi:hypothetical protein